MRTIRANIRKHTAVAGILSVVLCSCGAKPDPINGRTAIDYWHTLSGAAGDAQDEIAARFNAGQNNVEVTAEYEGTYGDLAAKLIAAAAAKSGPDVTQLGTFEIREFARSGVLVDLKPFLHGPAGIDRSDWPATFAHAGDFDGGTYWLPFNVAVPVMYYNKDAFAEAGLVGPPVTWGEFFDDAKRLTKRDPNGVRRAGAALWSNTWPLFSMIWSEGGELTNADYTNITLNDPVVVRLFDTLQSLVRGGAIIVPDKASGGHRAAFVSGRAAMILDSQDGFSEVFGQTKDFVPAIAGYPAGAKGKVYAPGGGGIAMFTTVAPERREAAWAFMRFMLEPEQIAYYAKVSGYAAFTASARKALGDTMQDPRYKTIHDALPYVRADFSVNESPAVRNAFDEAFQKILLRNADPQRTLDEADAKAEEAVRRELSR